MATRFTLCGMFFTLCCAAGALLAQESNQPAPPDGQTVNANNAQAQDDSLTALAESVRRVEMRIDALSEQYVTREEFQKLQDIVANQTEALGRLQEFVSEQATQIKEIDDKYDLAITSLNEQAAQVSRILDAISLMDSQNRPVLNIAGAMQSGEFQEDFSQALNTALPQTRKTGTLTITNNMPTTQVLRINGVAQAFAPYTSRSVAVPVGTVTTELAGEDPKNWVVAPPTYSQGVIIAPRQTTTSYLLTTF